jgi:hypothetical protein
VAGRAVSNLRMVLSPAHPGTVELSVLHSESSESPPAAGPQDAGVVITASQAGGLYSDGVNNAFARGDGPGPIETSYLQPGQYWLHAHFEQKGLCESSFTAGGANLAREPVTLGLNGAVAPLELAARDDCAKLTLTLPAAAVMPIGEEPFYTIYVIPDFDSTTDVEPLTMRPTSGSSVTLGGLTPGAYHVYTFAGTAALEYRNRDVLAGLSDVAQAVTLSPGTTGSLILEAPAH